MKAWLKLQFLRITIKISLSPSHSWTFVLKYVLCISNILSRKQQPIHRNSHIFCSIISGVWPGRYSPEPAGSDVNPIWFLVPELWATQQNRAIKSYQDTKDGMWVSGLLIIKQSDGLSGRIKLQTHGYPKVYKFPSLLPILVLNCCKWCEIMVLTDLPSPQTRCVDLP